MFGARLKAAREAKGLTMDELVTLYKKKFPISGLNKGTLSKYENEKQEPMINTVNRLAEILEVSVDYLSGKLPDQNSEESRVKPVDLNSADYVKVTNDIRNHIDLYTQLLPAGRQAADDNVFTLLMFQQAMQKQAAAACDTRVDELTAYRELRQSQQGFSAGHGVYLGPEAFDSIRVQDNELTRRATFCGPVAGDSMEPLYHDGDIILVDSETEVDVDEIGIFTLDGHGYVKKRGYVDLISLNPAYDPIPLDDSIRCNGKVIGVLNPKWIAEV